MSEREVAGVLSDEEVSQILRMREVQFASRREWADHLGLSAAFLTQVMVGTKRPSPRILQDVGLERQEVIVFAEASDA